MIVLLVHQGYFIQHILQILGLFYGLYYQSWGFFIFLKPLNLQTFLHFTLLYASTYSLPPLLIFTYKSSLPFSIKWFWIVIFGIYPSHTIFAYNIKVLNAMGLNILNSLKRFERGLTIQRKSYNFKEINTYWSKWRTLAEASLYHTQWLSTNISRTCPPLN